jgi:hypothetical protein
LCTPLAAAAFASMRLLDYFATARFVQNNNDAALACKQSAA